MKKKKTSNLHTPFQIHFPNHPSGDPQSTQKTNEKKDKLSNFMNQKSNSPKKKKKKKKGVCALSKNVQTQVQTFAGNKFSISTRFIHRK
jgi:hypothetical protein